MAIPAIKEQLFNNSTAPFQALQSVIWNAPTVTVLCGAGVSTSAGINDFRSTDGLYHQTFNHGGGTIRGRELFDLETLNQQETLVALNKVMLDLRLQARNASPSAFHDLVYAFFRLGSLVQCYTQNFDGLQTRKHPEMERVVYEIHGSNTKLKCRVCQWEIAELVEQFDQQLADDGIVACPHCLERAERAQQANKRARAVGYLAPAILFNQESAVGRDGQDYHKMLQKDGRSTQLFLIVGTSLLTPGIACMARSLAGWVRRNKGLVVYVNRKPPAAGWGRYIDLYLETEINQWATVTLSEGVEVRNKGTMKKFGTSVDKLRALLQQQHPPPVEKSPVADGTVLQATGTDRFSGATVRPQMPTSPCLEPADDNLTRVSKNAPALPIAQTNMQNGSAIARLPEPKLLVVVLHHVEVSAEASLLGKDVAALLTQAGWESACHVRNIYDPGPIDSPFGRDPLHILLVHLTGFIRSFAGGNKDTWEADDISEILAIGRKQIRRLSDVTVTCQAVLVCSGKHLLCAKEMRGLEMGLLELFHFHNVLICSDLRSFGTGEWAKFIADAGQSLVQARDEAV